MANINSLRKLSDTDKTNVKRGNAYRIDPRIIKIRPGHNPRGVFTDNYWETEAALAHIENFRQAYTNGDFVPVPVTSDDEFNSLVSHSYGILDKIADGCDTTNQQFESLANHE
ncbi:TPA: hypothetical protein LR168_004349 [Escherichia coli]|nr:hypothetical protein [Escherichia coli]